MEVDEAPSRTEGIPEKDSDKVPESLEIEDASHRSQQTALALYQEEFSKSRADLSRREVNFQGFSEERNALKLLSGQKEEEIKDLRAKLAKAYQDQTDLIEQKIERIEQFRKEVDTIKGESLGWKEGMNCLTAEKETTRTQLSSVESQLQGMKEKSSAQARKIEELEARLASEFAKAEKAKVEADAIVAVYQADAEAAQVQVREATETAQTRAYLVAELAKCHIWRETLEEIHARGFDLTKEILKAKELEADAGALTSNDDDNDDESKNGSERGGGARWRRDCPRDNQETYGFFHFDLFA
ncbi:MAR-binding filament-like protein 1-1 [Nicotiana tomentosiformis]|uniref:MAR-binding filament-like protein 1-1 n=1 Tax=Nicotiana tomentosiformis TaxID=4098 RepID=UPI00388CD04E